MYVCICFSYQIEKAIVPYKELQTTDGARTAEVEFQAMLVNLPEVANGQNRYITAGLEYGDSTYIWVGQASITTKATMKTMDVSLCLKYSKQQTIYVYSKVFIYDQDNFSFFSNSR